MAYNAFASKDKPAAGSFTTEAFNRLIVQGVLLTRSVAHLIVHPRNYSVSQTHIVAMEMP